MERYNFAPDSPKLACLPKENKLNQLDVFKGTLKSTKQEFLSNCIPFRKHKVSCLADDFYTNLVSWSKDCIVYAIEDKIYSFNFNTSKAELIYTFENKVISALYFSADGAKLAVGCNAGNVELLDINTLKTQQYRIHRSRVGVVEWSGDSFFTGSRDRQIKLVDPRSGTTQIWLSGHQQEICGLKLNCCKSMLASGGNDNLMFVYDSRIQKYPLHMIKNHHAAVKALSWSPIHPYSVISGGGTADKTIKMWDLSNKAPVILKSLDTKSQVCNLYWTESNCIISTHGYSQNDSRVFSDGLLHKSTNRGHRNRIIHFAMSTDEQYYLTGSADNILNIWKIDSDTKSLDFR